MHAPAEHVSPLPVIVADTSVLLELAKAQEENDYRAPPSDRSRNAQPMGEIIDAMLGNSRTLVIPRRNFVELFRTHTGHLDLGLDAEGNPRFVEGIDEQHFKYSNAAIIYQLFSRYQREGKLKFYKSLTEMTRSGALDEANGSIVIVDDGTKTKHPREGLRYNKNGSSQSLWQHYIGGTESLDRDPEASRSIVSGPRDSDGLGEVDQKFATFVHKVAEAAPGREFMVLNGDYALMKRISNDPLQRKTHSIRPLELPFTLTQTASTPAITMETASAYADAMAAEHARRGRTLTVNPDGFHSHVASAARWLNATSAAPEQSHAPASRWSDSPHLHPQPLCEGR